MASGWWNISREESSGMPTMLVQAIVAAAALCVGEILCAPVYVNMASHSLALVPWAMVACLLAVAFVYTVGFALFWCVEALTARGRRRYQPIVYGLAGMIGFGFWGRFVLVSFLDSLLAPLNLAQLGSNQIAVIVVNSAVLGFAAFFLGSISPKLVAGHRTGVIATGVATFLVAVAGAYYLYQMYAFLY